MASERVTGGKTWQHGGRRGLLAGAAALVGVGLAKIGSARPAEAGHNDSTPYASEGVLHLDVVNTAASETYLDSTTSGASLIARNLSGGRALAAALTGAVFTAQNNNCAVLAVVDSGRTAVRAEANLTGIGVLGLVGGEGAGTAAPAGPIGVVGLSQSGIGVLGRSQSLYGTYGRSFENIGAIGESDANNGVYGVSQGRTGVRGRGAQFGVLAENSTNAGVALRAPIGTGVGVFGSVDGAGSGVYGEGATGGAGVLGVSNQGSGVIGRGGQYGVLAETLAGSSVALRARTGSGLGVYGSSTDQNGSGVYGENTSGGGIGVRAFSQGVALYAQGGSRAAVFIGDVEIRGNLIRSGGAGSPDAAVRDGGQPGGRGRIVDDGRGRLVNGRGTVTLDAGFLAQADTSDYDVTLTAYGDCRGLFVAARTPGGFEVREFQAGTATLEFGYRVSARAKATGAPSRGIDLGPGGAGVQPAGGPGFQAPEIPPAWRGDGAQPPAAIPSEWRDIPPPPTLPRAD